ncbi:phenylalanine--tRNA ligase subunit beta [Candidatus Woesearchaeota archaeon B3_Woes]|nr:MAG: phenylalanine--tRNA ligase subunit beta [Candidatus Woesearchaeota archaeon B3_Woes]
MPTINFSLKDLQKLIGKKITLDELQDLLSYAKAELEDYDKSTDEATADFGDTNLPYLWSTEGIARLIKGILGKEKGIPKLTLNKSPNHTIIVENSVTKIRPYIATFVAKGCKVDDYLIKQIIQLQEKLCETYGRKRKKIAIGVFNYSKIKFPLHYKAVQPNKIKFIPLGYKKEMDLNEILEEHPKGQEYSWILEGFERYPILIDDENKVLSFPPIINSNETGKIEEKDSDLFFDITGTDLESVLVVCNIFAQAMHDRGFKIFSVDTKYPNKKITTPFMFNDSIKLKIETAKEVLGLDLKEAEIKTLLEKQRYDYKAGKVLIPSYRKDILHIRDVIEDIGIAYGYNKIEELPLTSYTPGSTSQHITFLDKIREMIVGLGFQEVMSQILSNKNLLYNKMEIEDFGTVELQNPTSENYSVLRTWIVPILMEFLSKNKHVEYPQNIFEQGTVTIKKEGKIIDYERIAALSISEKADYTKIKQTLDCLMRMLDIEYKIEETKHDSFIEGRVGRIIVNDKKVGYIGEINPKVIYNFNLEMPVIGFEINISELFSTL